MHILLTNPKKMSTPLPQILDAKSLKQNEEIYRRVYSGIVRKLNPPPRDQSIICSVLKGGIEGAGVGAVAAIAMLFPVTSVRTKFIADVKANKAIVAPPFYSALAYFTIFHTTKTAIEKMNNEKSTRANFTAGVLAAAPVAVYAKFSIPATIATSIGSGLLMSVIGDML
eukprot:GEZU01035960.1.p1 GENE.GEZU01035960.1~~GEZU01035960.1.p1  ORF type:complete len:169 (+),score=52.65 GEZU01035960.1:344-850(+)